MANWRNYVRDIFAEYHPRVIGGQGEIVEIDESAFVRRKYNRGRQVNTQCVFGGICVRTKLGFLVPVDQSDADPDYHHCGDSALYHPCGDSALYHPCGDSALYHPCGDSADVPEVRQRKVARTTVSNGVQRRGRRLWCPP